MIVRRALNLICAALIGVASPVMAEEVAASKASRAQETVEPRVMVMLDLGADHYTSAGDYGGPYGNAMREQARLRIARKIASEHGLTLIESWPMQMIGVDCVIMSVNDNRSPETVAAEISHLPGVAWSQPLNEYVMQAAPGVVQKPYNDRLYAAQPASASWKLNRLHQVTTGKGVTIAIVDSRIDTKHPDLVGQIAVSPDFAPKARTTGERHGTGVAGIIAARPNNALGIAGVAPGARILGLRACWERPLGGMTVCDSLSLAKALTYALENRADVINLSLTGPTDRLLQTLIEVGIKRGVTIVAAVDEARPQTSFPAFVKGVVPVSDERLPAGTPAVYIAPGMEVPTTEPEGKWSIVSGSSFAAAHVSGLAALLRQLAGSDSKRMTSTTMFGPRGQIDACAAVSRLSQLESPGCEAGR